MQLHAQCWRPCMENRELTCSSVVRGRSVLHPEGGGRHAARSVPLARWGAAAAQCPGLVGAQPVGPVGVLQLMAARCRPGGTAVAKWSVVRSCRHPDTNEILYGVN